MALGRHMQHRGLANGNPAQYHLRNCEFGDLLKTLNPYWGVVFVVACYLGITILGKREGTELIYFQFRAAA
jgi:hypothetical protein